MIASKYADPIEEKIKNGSAGKLAGMVIAIKDVLALKDQPVNSAHLTF